MKLPAAWERFEMSPLGRCKYSVFPSFDIPLPWLPPAVKWTQMYLTLVPDYVKVSLPRFIQPSYYFSSVHFTIIFPSVSNAVK